MADIFDPFAENTNELNQTFDPFGASGADDPFDPFKEAKPADIFDPFSDLPTEPSVPPDAVVSNSSLPADPPSADLPRPAPVASPMQSAFDANALLREQEMALAADQQQRVDAGRIAEMPNTKDMPSIFNPDAQYTEEQRIKEIMAKPGPTVEKAQLNLNPRISGVSGVPGNYMLNTPLGDTPIDDATAAEAIARGNTTQLPNNAFTRGVGRVENVVNIFGQQLGLQDTQQFIDNMQELNRIYPDAPKDVQNGLREISEAETMKDALRAMLKNPGAVLSVVGESLPQMIPGLFAAAGMTATGNPIGAAVALGSSSGAMEYGNVLMEEIQSSGVDINDDNALAALMQNPEFWSKARDRGIRRGVPIAVLDAMSMGFAGKLVGVAQKTGRYVPVAAAAVGEVGIQGGLGSTGELLAQLAERQGGYRKTLNPGEIALEGVAELVPGAAEVAMTTANAKANFDPIEAAAKQTIKDIDAAQFETSATQEAASRMASPPVSTEQIVNDLADRAEAAGQVKFAKAMRLNAKQRGDQITPDQIAFYQQRVSEYEAQAGGTEAPIERNPQVFISMLNKNDYEKRSFETAKTHPEAGPLFERMEKIVQDVANALYNRGYDYLSVVHNDLKIPEDVREASAFIRRYTGSAARLRFQANAILKGHKAADQGKFDQTFNNIQNMPLPSILGPNPQQSIEQPNSSTASGALPAQNAVNSQTVEMPSTPSSLEQPSAPSTSPSEIPQPPQPVQAQTQAAVLTQDEQDFIAGYEQFPLPENKAKYDELIAKRDAGQAPQAPDAPTPPSVSTEPPQQPAVQLNPQEAEEVGTDTDNVVKSVQTPDGQANYNVKGKVIELADLKQAQGELQPRDRSRKESEALAKERAGTMFNPSRLLDDPTTGSGAPIIARDGTILSGNGRILTMQEVYANQPESLARYRQALNDAGINTEGFSQPVFVRQLTDNMSMQELRRFADLSNTEAQAQMSMTERATRDATRLTDSKIIDMYRGDFDIDAAQNRGFVSEYAKKILSPTEQGSFFDSTGQISQEGISRVRNAILASAFDNPDTLATMLESSDENIKAISSAFMATAPKFAQLKKQIADGRTDAQFDITPQLADMANLISRLRRDGTKLQDYYNQSDMLSQPDPEVQALVQAFYNNDLSRANSAKAMKDFLTFYVDEALQKESGGLIPDTTTASDIIDAGRKRTEEKRNAGKGQQAGLDLSPSVNGKRNDAGGKQVQERTDTQSRERPAEAKRKTERKVNDTRSQDLDQKNIEGVIELRDAQTTTPDKAETREDNSRGTKAGRVTIAQSQTLRQSLYRDAFHDAGLDPDTAINFPIQRQYRILSNLLTDKFGFTLIEKPKQGAGYDQVNALLDAYHNLQWMAHVLGMPNKAIGLDGTLALALPQRAWGGYLAAYVNKQATNPSSYQSDVNPVTGPVILMPGRSNSFAHEWGHALDFHIMDRIGQDWGRGLTGRIRTNLEKGEMVYADNAPQNVVEAMGDVMNAMFFDNAELAAEIMQLESEVARLEAKQAKSKSGKPIKKLADAKEQLRKLREGSTKKRIGASKYRMDAEQFATDNNSDVSYWTRPTEMFARAFESYVSFMVESVGGNTEFIAFENEAYKMALDKVKGGDDRLALTYPKDEDRMRIFLAMDALMSTLRSDILEDGPAAAAPGDMDMIDAQSIFYDNINLSKTERMSLIEDQKKAWNQYKLTHAREKARPKRYSSAWAKFQDTIGVNFINTKRGHLFNLAKRYKNNPRAKALIESIIARVAPDPGSTDNRVTVAGGAFEEAVRGASRRYTGTFVELIDKHGLMQFTDEELQQLRLFLTSDQTAQANADPKVKRAAGDLRNRLLNPMYDYMRKNGLDVNYLPEGGYMPRMLDALLVVDQKEKFIGDGTKKRGAKALYSDVIYENELGELDTQDVEQARELLNLANRKSIKPLLDENAADLVKELSSILKEIDVESKKLEDPDVDPGEVDAKILKLQEEAETYHAELYEELRDPYSTVAAEDWYERVVHRQVGDISRHGVQGSFAKSRKLPAEADTYMVDFYLNPVDALSQYIPGVTRKVEYEKRFGTKNVPEGKRTKTTGTSIDGVPAVHDYLSYVSQEMASAGMKEHEIREIQYIVETVTGTRARSDGSLTNVLNTFNTYGNMALLPRAVLSSVAEPMTAAITSGKVTDGFRSFAYAMDEFMTSMRGATAKERKQYYKQLGNILGVIDLPESGEVIANRIGGTAEDDTKNSARLGRFFFVTGLVSVTNAQRRGAMRVGLRYISSLGEQYLNGASERMKGQARDALQDFGVRPEDMDQFAEYAAKMKANDSGMYEIDNIIDRSGELTDMGEILALAMQRFANFTVQDPQIIDRPKHAETPVGRVVYGIQSFIAAFQRNVLLASAKRVQREYQQRGATSAALFGAASVALPMGSLFLAHTVVSTAREALLNPDKWKEEKENGTLVKYLLTLGLSRSGFTGRFDPLVNALTSLKYQADLSNMLAGSSGAYFLKQIQRMIMPFTERNSPNTVSAEYQGLRGAYDVLVPLGLAFVASDPRLGTALGAVAGVADMVATSPGVKHWVVRNIIKSITGEEYRPARGNRQKKKDEKKTTW